MRSLAETAGVLCFPRRSPPMNLSPPRRVRNRRRHATPEQHDHDHRYELLPYERLLGQLLQSSGRIEERLFRLELQVARNEQADKRRDEKAMALEDDILAKLAEAKTRDDGFRVLLKAIKDNQNNPAKLAQIAASIDENEGAWTSAFAENVPPVEPA